MDVNLNLEAFTRQLADLIGRFADLGAKLGEAARELQDGGAPPADALVEALAAARLEFIELRAEIVLAAETLGVAVPDHVESARRLEPVLAAMGSALEAHRRRATFEETRGRILAVLDRIDGVTHQDDANFGPLVTAKVKAAELKNSVLALADSSLEQAQAVFARAQPFADLLSMLDATDAIDDARFSALEESVAHAFGRQIAVAVARHRLLLPGQAPRPAPAQTASSAAPAPAAVELAPAERARPVESRARENNAADETAQWWLAAWARWSGWKNSLAFPDAVREELAKYPYLLSVPIQQSAEFEDGLLAYGYSILMQHVEEQTPGCVGNALNNLKTGRLTAVGTQLYDYLVAEGWLTETYPEFIKNVLLAAVPEPGPWVQARIIHSADDTRVFQRPSERTGDSEQTAQRYLAEHQRFREHKFAGSLAPLTTRFFSIHAELRDAHGVEAKLSVDGAPSDAGLFLTLPAAGRATKKEVRRLAADGTPVPGLGRDYAALWFAVFNADPARETRFELAINLRKDTRGMRK